MPRYISENEIYALFDRRGQASLHVGDIDVLPRATVVEPVHAAWVRRRVQGKTVADEVYCSCCFNVIGVVFSDTGFEECKTGQNFCSKCGAKMDEEEPKNE